jgi:hypothetical protein
VYKNRVEVPTLRISLASTQTVAEILTQDNNHVSISATQGSVDVRNRAGVLVATVRPGLALAFTVQVDGAAIATKLSRYLVKKGDKYLLTDSTTGVTVELQGTRSRKARRSPSPDHRLNDSRRYAGNRSLAVDPSGIGGFLGAACKVPTGAVVAARAEMSTGANRCGSSRGRHDDWLGGFRNFQPQAGRQHAITYRSGPHATLA